METDGSRRPAGSAPITFELHRSFLEHMAVMHAAYLGSDDGVELWLDENMVYSCAYFENGDEDLATAQIKKIDHILTKIQLQPGQRLLDIPWVDAVRAVGASVCWVAIASLLPKSVDEM